MAQGITVQRYEAEKTEDAAMAETLRALSRRSTSTGGSLVSRAAGCAGRGARFCAESRRPLQLLQLGLAFVFVYAASSTLIHPAPYRSYLPLWLVDMLSPSITDGILRAFAVFELALALGVVTQRFCCIASLLSAVTLLGIVALNGDAFEVLFRNVAIICAALALAALTGGEKKREVEQQPVTDSESAVPEHLVVVAPSALPELA